MSVSTSAGYQSPVVAVASALPKRKVASSVLIVPVVSSGDDDGRATVVANPFLDAEAVGEIEVALEALGAKGGGEQVTRIVVPALPVGSVLAVGLGKARDEWPAETIRRAAGVAARSINGVENVFTTLSAIDLEATIEGLLRFTEPGGGFLRDNDPASGRWYSRDVAAIASSFSAVRASSVTGARSSAASASPR